MMVIDTPEAARNLEAAFREAEKRGPLNLDYKEFEEILRRGEEFLKNNPNWLKEVVAVARAELIKRGELPDTDE